MSSICSLKTGFMVDSPRCIDCIHSDLDVLASNTLRKPACMKRHRTRATHVPAELHRDFPLDLMFVNSQRRFEAHLARLTFSHTMDEYTQARCQAAENAALLVCLREQPSVPHENKQPACNTLQANVICRYPARHCNPVTIRTGYTYLLRSHLI
jgi:hypothetical protein